MFSQIVPLQYLDIFNQANAATDSEMDLSYPNGTKGFKMYFSSSSLMTTETITVNEVPGKVIDEVALYKNDVKVQSVPAASNNRSWSGTATIAGEGLEVKSVNNEALQQYYAFYRYTPNDPKGVKWYQNGGSCPSPSPSGSFSSPNQEIVNGYKMPLYPDCFDNTLEANAARTSPFRLNGSEIPSTVVDPSTATFNTSLDSTAEIEGPEAGMSGFLDHTTQIIGGRMDGPDRIIIQYSQNFNHEGDVKKLGLPGAKLMVYYAAFKADIIAKTYTYPDKVKVTYKDAPTTAEPDLGNLKLIPPAACIEVGKAYTYRFTFQNIGSANISQSFNVQVLLDGSNFQTFPFNGLSAGASAEGSFSYTFTSATTKTFTISIDKVTGETSTSNNVDQFPITAKTSCTGDPGGGPGPGGPEVIKGDFVIDKMQIYYKENNKFIPKDVSVSGGNNCTFQSVKWTVKQGGGGYDWLGTTPWTQEFTGTPYPGGIGLGTVEVTLTITTTCGTTKVIGPKTFTIVDDPNNPNRPPVFEGGWFHRFNTTYYPPITTAIEGDMVHLGIVHDPTQTPNTPYDPDGDGIIYTWNFAGSTSEWIRNLPKTDPINFGIHNENFRWIKADVVGTHTIEVSAVDTRGKSGGTKKVTLNVIPKDPPPVPIITLPPRVIEGRPYSPPISCEKSFSPHPDRYIAGCYWTGKQTIYPTAGDYPITLSVTDNTGKESVAPATATLPVLPDLPPIAQLNYPALGIRDVAMNMKDTSFSPDGDTIDVRQLTLYYDSNNNGSYDDEAGTPISTDASGNFTITPKKVGKYKIHVYVREAEGYKKSDAKDFYFEVVNEAPDASFYIEGSDFTPPEYVTTSFSAADMINGGNWRASSVAEPDKSKEYAFNAGQNTLEAYEVFPKGTFYSVSPQQFRSFNPNQVTQNKYKTWSCESWTTGCDASVTMLTDKLAYSWVWRMSFTNLANTMPTGYKPSAVEGNSGYTWFPKVNVEDDLVWFRAKSEDTLGGYWRYHYKDYVFHVSDLEAASLSGTGLAPTPLYHNEFTSAKENNWQEPPTPPMWIEPPSKADPSNAQTTYAFTEDGTSFSTKTQKTVYSGDKQGNLFGYYCLRDTSQWGSSVYNCALEKKTPAGNLIWRINDVFSSVPEWSNSGSTYKMADRIVYMTNDGTKLVVETLSGLKIIDVGSGNIIDQINASDYKLFGNKIVFFTSTRGPDGQYYNRTDGEYRWSITYDMRFSVYDIATGVRSVANEIIGNHNTESQTATAGTPPQITLSADGKALFATRYNKQSKLYVYDVNGATKIGEVSPPSEYLPPDSPDKFYEAPVLYQDGKVFIRMESGSTNRLWQVEGAFDSATANVPNSGQLYNSSDTLESGELVSTIRFNYNYFTPHITAGISARIQNHKNMYRLEVSPSKTRLVKLVNGMKTVLQEVDYSIQFRKDYQIKLKINGNRLRGYVGGIPLIDVNDSAFASGVYGPYSETPYVSIKNLSVTKYESDDNKLRNIAIVGTPFDYVKHYADRENDPPIDDMTRWTFQHIEPNKFLDAGDGYSGISAYNGHTVNTPYPMLDKVGKYKMDYQVQDDPAPAGYKYPNGTFANYRKYSDVDSQYVIIHRRPVAKFTVSRNADGTLAYNDTSYDPDRWLSPTNYSTEPTGIDYQSNRGILQWKYNYTTPSGVTKLGQLGRPLESGRYTIRLAVADEYAAWSDWYEQELDVDAIPNNPPVAVLTFPTGTKDNPDYVSLRPTITWNQSDPDPNTTFTGFELAIKDEWGSCFECITKEITTKNTSWAWTMDKDLFNGAKYSVQVRVRDDASTWSPWSNVGWMQTNRPPQAYMSFPFGTQANPTVVNTLRPTLTWTQSDPDPGAVFHFFQLQITNEANNVMILDSGKLWQGTTATSGSWYVTQDLPTGQKMRVRVKVWDQYGAESEWSPQAWMLINRPPVAEFTWTPEPAWEGDTITLINQSTDPDGDPLTFVWNITGPNNYSSVQTTTDASIPASVTNYNPGDYIVQLTATDPYGANSSITKTVVVRKLTVEATLKHTPEWTKYYGDYGMDLSLFMAGEPFVTEATTSPTATNVTAQFVFPRAVIPVPKAFLYDENDSQYPDFAYTSVLATTNRTEWNDRVIRKYWIQIPDGTYDVNITATFSNGQIRTKNLKVVINNHIWGNKKEGDSNRG